MRGWDCEVVTCSCLSSEEAGEDTQGLSETGWSAPKRLFVTCGSLSSVEDGVEAAGVSLRGWDCEVVTCSCLLLAFYSFSCLPPFISCSFFSLFCYLSIILNSLPSPAILAQSSPSRFFLCFAEN